jgi:hypothetical protein
VAQALAGEVEAATATFERAVAATNDVGLLAEEVDPRSGEMIRPICSGSCAITRPTIISTGRTAPGTVPHR